MLKETDVSKHYEHGDLLGAIQSSVTNLGKTISSITVEDLAPVDEFHIGGRIATDHLLKQLNFTASDHILDVGCGLGGTSRFVVSKYQNHVTGIDLTNEYIETGVKLCEWVGLGDQITLQQGSALTMPFPGESFDGSVMLHVGMNIEDKRKLFNEVSRVLRTGAYFGIYDIMRKTDGKLAYPVPWAADSSTSMLSTAEEYKQALQSAGFSVLAENDRSDFALDFFKQMRARMETNGGPPPLGLHTLMKESTPLKIKNMVDNIASELIAPVEMIARKD